MCGIIFVAGNIDFKADKALKSLLILDSVRGMDSTGIAAMQKNGDVSVVKALGHPFELFDHRSFQPTLNRSNRAIIGHNRFATQGKVTRKNAHPFDFDTLVGVHNGTLTNKYKLLDANQFDVDSENLYWHMEQKGLEDLLDTMNGAWNLVWWDKLYDTLNILRNKERPMYITESLDGKTIFGASEEWMLKVACHKSDIKIKDIHEVVEDMHYCIGVDAQGNLAKPVVRHRPSTYVAPVQQHQGFQNFKGAGQQTNGTKAVQQQQKNNVLALPHVNEKKSQMSVPASGSFYVNSKGVRLELVALAVDSRGSTYVNCMDMDNPDVDVRIYYNGKDNLTCNIGQYVTADIKDVVFNPKDGKYFKVARDSVKMLNFAIDTKKILGQIAEEDGPPFEFEPQYKDHRGKAISLEEFNNSYGTCACCTGYVDPTKKFKFAVNGEAVCHVCVLDSSVANMVNLM